jgi:superfamily II DNA helicase RecQ
VDTGDFKFEQVDFQILEERALTDNDIKTVLVALKLNNDAEIPLYLHQLEAMISLSQLKDTIVISPCSSGKSRIIDNAPLIIKLALSDKGHEIIGFPLAIINTPLNAIMKEKIQKSGQSCLLTMNGKLEYSNGSNVWDEKTSHLYAHPESLVTSQGKELLKKNQHRIMVHIVDEAHVMFDWTDQFRPLVKTVPGSNRVFAVPEAPMLALSATLRPSDLQELMKWYGMSRRPHNIIKINPVPGYVYVGLLSRPSNQTDFDAKGGLGEILDGLCLAQFKESPLKCQKVLILSQSDTKIREKIIHNCAWLIN